MNHLTEEQLILHYYGEEGDALPVEVHLDECDSCRSLYGSLQRVLNVVDSMPVPERGEEYGAEVWRRIESRIPHRRRFGFGLMPWRWAAVAGACAALMIAAFVAGRFYDRAPAIETGEMASATEEPNLSERVLLVAVDDYLERSQMVLIELANANPKRSLDISSEQERAAELVSESRLYRHTAQSVGHTAVTGVLEDLDRVLLEIAHAPSRLSPEELEKFRERLKAEGILFKIRVLGSNVRNQEAPAREAREIL
jgi:hypothetical protein